jgi:hypothetical protein
VRVIIVESGTRHIDDVRREMLTWAEDLGVNTKKAMATFLLAEDDLGYWSAHFSIKRGPAGDPNGPDIIIPGTNRLDVDYGGAVFPVKWASWPKWFGTPEDISATPVPALLELLAIAESARLQLRVAHHRRSNLGVIA